jgi:hypothetical protein
MSASLYNMFMQVSGMIGGTIGANICQPIDASRCLKANKGLLVICLWMCLIQYPGTYFYYQWRNHRKTKVWDTFTDEEKDNYRTATAVRESNGKCYPLTPNHFLMLDSLDLPCNLVDDRRAKA